MGEVRDLPPAVLRALDGIADGSGRTVVVAGPEGSGKTGVLETILDEAARLGLAVRRLQGSYRERNTAFGLVRGLDGAPTTVPAPGDVEEATPEGGAPPDPRSTPFAALAFEAPEAPTGRRARGERQKGRILGVSYATRGRGVERFDAEGFWERTSTELRAPGARGMLLAVDDATFADDDSRDALVFLATRAPLAPLLLVVVLDSSNPSQGQWERALDPVPSVEWVRTRATRIDPREASRVRRLVDALPPASRRVLVALALLDGTSSEVRLARIARRTFPELADALLPAAEARLVRVEPGKITLGRTSWIDFLPTLLPEEEVRGLHREIAEALEALHPEPSLEVRREYARHFLASEASAVALRHLRTAIDEARRVSAYDVAGELAHRALACLPALAPPERARTGFELRLVGAISLLFSGRSAEVGPVLREAFDAAFRDGVDAESLVDGARDLVPALLAVGPRPALLSELGELLERLARTDLPEAEALFGWVLAEGELARSRYAQARHEAHRVARLVRRHPRDVTLSALALAVSGVVAARGVPADLALAERHLESATYLFEEAHQTELELLVAARREEVLRARGADPAARELAKRSIPTLTGRRQPSIELDHQLALAEIDLDLGAVARAEKAAARAAEIVRFLALGPPSPGRFRLWSVEARVAAGADEFGRARDRWRAIVDAVREPGANGLRAASALRWAALEALHDRPEVARELFDRPEIGRLFPNGKPPYDAWAGSVRERAGSVRNGAAPLATLVVDAGA